MLTLMVTQKLNTGATKTWKLRASEPTKTFGSSRLADLISISNMTTGIESVFEYKNNSWYLHDLSQQSFGKKQSPSICIDKEMTLDFGSYSLKLVPLSKQVDVFSKLEKTSTESKSKKIQLFIAKQNNRVVEFKTLPLGSKFRGISSQNTPDWVYNEIGGVTIQQRTIGVDDIAQYAHLKYSDLVDQESKKGVYIVLASTVFILAVGLLGPKTPQHVAAIETPKIAQKIIVKNDFKKPRKASEPKQQASAKPSAPAPAAPSKEAPAQGGKVANMLKSISDGRLSKMISKVSSQSAKTTNVIISNGVKAGQGPSGRALAALSTVDRPGRDWGTDSNGKAIAISTAGRGGGKNTGGLGGLGAGSTGNAGVGLIEEESEITGGLDREVIAQYIKSQLGQILYCYERQLSANPDLFGKVAIKFTITGNGGVERQLIGDSTLKNATVEGCILNRVAAWKFPAPQGGTKVLVTYPFLFKSTN